MEKVRTQAANHLSAVEDRMATKAIAKETKCENIKSTARALSEMQGKSILIPFIVHSATTSESNMEYLLGIPTQETDN